MTMRLPAPPPPPSRPVARAAGRLPSAAGSVRVLWPRMRGTRLACARGRVHRACARARAPQGLAHGRGMCAESGGHERAAHDGDARGARRDVCAARTARLEVLGGVLGRVEVVAVLLEMLALLVVQDLPPARARQRARCRSREPGFQGDGACEEREVVAGRAWRFSPFCTGRPVMSAYAFSTLRTTSSWP